MSLYYIIVNDSRQEFVDVNDYDLSISNWNTIKHGLLMAYIMVYTSWEGENVRIVHDGSGLNDEYQEIAHSGKWKNKADDFIKDFNITLEEELKRYRIKKTK